MTPEEKKDHVQEHIERCSDLYGQAEVTDFNQTTVDRESYEQVRMDLLLAIGMLAAIRSRTQEDKG